jgi:predicted AAA+ superfamily ATPase
VDDVLERLITDFQSAPLPDTVRRDIEPLPRERKADTFIGMRRSGKTFAMLDVMRRLLDEGVPKSRLLYLNMDDDRLGSPDPALLDRALETYYRTSPASRTDGAYLFFDEIQVVPGWERFARRVIDSENAHLVLAGSSAKLLSTEVATTLRGRSFALEVLPYGLREYLRASDAEPEQWPPDSRTRSRIAALAERYLVEGGFPETVGMSSLERTQALQSYVELVTIKDVVERHRVENLVALRHLVAGAFAANAGPFSVSALHGALTSRGIRVTKLAYLDHLNDAYLLFLVPIRSRSEKARTVNARKVYSVDPGLAAAMYGGGALNRGALLANAVYLELRRRLGTLAGGAVTYHRTKPGLEADFVVDSPVPDARPEIVQACLTVTDAPTLAREVRSTTEAMSEIGVRTATIVTLNDARTIETEAGTIEVVPLWEWVLR